MATSQKRTFVGIDIAADTFTASTYAGPSAEGTEPATFTNDEDGFKVFAGWLLGRKASPDGSTVCMEATGVYAEALCHDLHGRGYRVAVETPLRVQRAFKTSANKTDSVDSQQIAEYAFRFEDELPPWTPPEAIVEHVL